MKLTEQRLKKIIAEEYQKILNEENQQDQSGSDNKDAINRNQLAMNFKQELSNLVKKASGVTGDEAALLQEMIVFIINAYHKKTIDDDKTEAMKNKIIQIIGQLKGDQ